MPPSTATKSATKPANLANTNAAPTPSVPPGAGNASPANEAANVDINATNSRIAELQAQLTEQQNKLATARTERLRNAHIEFGFPDTMSLIKSLRSVMAGGTIGADGSGSTRTRAVITDETKAQVKKLVGEKKTGEEIAAALGISVPSVQNIKKELKLTNTRKGK